MIGVRTNRAGETTEGGRYENPRAIHHHHGANPRRRGLRRVNGGVSCQNQDLLDYRILRIPPARVFDLQALIRIPLGWISDYGEKRKMDEAKS